MRRLLQALCLSAALVMPYNPFALAEQNRKAEEARKAEPAAPRAPTFGPNWEGKGMRPGFLPRASEMGMTQQRRVPDEKLQKSFREQMKERLYALADQPDGLTKLEKMAITMLRQRPNKAGARGSRRQAALERYIIDRAKTPAIIEVLLDSMGIIDDTDES